MRVTVSPLKVAAWDAALGPEGDGSAEHALPFDAWPVDKARRAELRAALNTVPGRMTMSAADSKQRAADEGRAGETGRRSRARKPARAAGWLGALSILVAAMRVSAQAPMTTAAATAAAKSGAGAKALVAGGDPAASSLEAYLTRVRQDNKAVQTTPGAIWTDQGRLTRMSTDVRAMRPHDLISVVVSESLAASTDGTVKNSRASNASSGISGLIGTLHTGNAMQNLLNANASSGLNAQGASATNSSLTTTFGGQVVEVLPNGMLVIEAARQVEFSQQTQTIVLRGLVRPEDISQQNQVLSTAISSMELQVRGKGIVNDYTRRQNPLARLLQWVLVF